MQPSARPACSNSYKIWAALAAVSFSLSLVLLNHTILDLSSTAGASAPVAIECRYSISMHVLRCASNGNPATVSVAIGPASVTSGTGECRDNPQCVGRKFKMMGPVEPGKYRMHRDTRDGGAELVRLEPVPPVPGWRVWLPGWMPGSLRGGFLLGIGDLTHGCIVVLKDDKEASAQFRNILRLLDRHPAASNELVVLP